MYWLQYLNASKEFEVEFFFNARTYTFPWVLSVCTSTISGSQVTKTCKSFSNNYEVGVRRVEMSGVFIE